ncbi:hypothetical protein BDB01DRAFT_57375 [Pilobolus umbonatus]|nr:hypothetical protein BDB01DRAFT_57375 [Pilobolus umbonatus]
MIITQLRSPSRIKRHINNFQVPVVHCQWIKDCIKAKEKLSYDEYLIELGKGSNITTNDKSMDTSPSLVSKVINDQRENGSDNPHHEILHKTFDKPDDSLIDLDMSIITESDQSSLDDEEDENIMLAPDFINTKYACLRPTPLIPFRNKRLLKLLLILEEKRELNGEDKNALSYRHAISAIKAYPRQIQSAKEASKIIGIGKKIAEKIRYYLENGTIEEAENTVKDERFLTLKMFNKVFGVGRYTAIAWWDQGYRSLQEVLEKANISQSIRLSIKLLPDLIQIMRRNDVEEIIEIISKEVTVVSSKSEVVAVGGYRRGKTENGDLDIIISTGDSQTAEELLNKLVDTLTNNGYIKHILLTSHKRNKHASSTTFGNEVKCISAFMQPSKHILRQVDLIVAENSELVTTILGWTGSRQFERSLREYAKKEKSLLVNNQGIYKEADKKYQLEVTSEEEAFKIIGVPYLTPEFRNC